MAVVEEVITEEVGDDSEIVESFDDVEPETPEVAIEAVEEIISEEASVERELPDKWQGKSVHDVVDAYTELQSEYGRQAQETGELRKLTDDILKMQLEQGQTEQPGVEPQSPVDVDDFFDNPEKAINKVLDNNPRLKAVEEMEKRHATTVQREAFEKKHTDAQSIVGSKEFQEWVMQSSVRADMYKKANEGYDYASGDELLSHYKATAKANVEQATEARSAKNATSLKEASVEKPSTGSVKAKKYRRADLIQLRIQNPAKYDAMADEIRAAYSEGRVI